LPENFATLTNPGINLLKEMLAAAAGTPQMKPARLAEAYTDHPDGGRALQTLLTQEVHLDDKSDWIVELRDTLNAILSEALQHRHEELIARADAPGGLSEAETAEFRDIPQQIARLKPRPS
jgi:hypothetical protein